MRILKNIFIPMMVCFVFVILALGGCGWINYERYDMNTEEMQITLSQGETLVDYLDYCMKVSGKYAKDMVLVGVEGELVPAREGVSFGNMGFTFYMYIDDSREGGYIKSTTFNIDGETNILTSIFTFEGAGKAFVGTMGSDVIDIDTQLDYSPDEFFQLFQQTEEYAQYDSTSVIQFTITTTASGPTIRWRTNQ